MKEGSIAMRRLRGVLLDVDGTLVESNDAHARAWVEALALHGISVPFEKVRPLIGMGGDKLLPEVSGILADSPRGKRISERRQEIFQQRYLPSLWPTLGAAQLLRRLKAERLKLVVASSAKEEEIEGLLRICGGDKLIHERTTSDKADHSKPDPDIVHAAVEATGFPTAEVVFLGDTPYDVEAGQKAGVAVIALRCGGWDMPELEGAVAVYNDPADLLAQYDTSPLAG
jgi:HAD superfamily hydrolase (TIGR01509 family)